MFMQLLHSLFVFEASQRVLTSIVWLNTSGADNQLHRHSDQNKEDDLHWQCFSNLTRHPLSIYSMNTRSEVQIWTESLQHPDWRMTDDRKGAKATPEYEQSQRAHKSLKYMPECLNVIYAQTPTSGILYTLCTCINYNLRRPASKVGGDTNFLNIELHLVLLYTCTYCHKAAIRERYSLDWSHFLGL